jgi:PAS domain S-box-containing protein
VISGALSAEVSREERLAAMVSLLGTAQEVGKVGTFIAWLTPDRVGLDEWSTTCMEIFGYDETTYDGTNEAFWRRVHPDDVEMVRRHQQAIFRGEVEHYDVRHRIVRPDGVVRWIRERAQVERDAAGSPIRFLGVTLDITEEHRAEEALRASVQWFRSVFDHSGIGMAISVDGAWVDVNRAFAQILNADPSVLVGRPFTDFALAEDIEPQLAEIEKVRSGAKELHTFELRFRRADGEIAWVRAHLSPVPDPRGVALLLQAEDITESKRIEREALQTRLEAEMKTRLVSMLNHEVRTPLNSILGFTELLIAEKGGPLSDKQRRYLDNVDRAGRHMLSLVSDNLDLAKIDAGRMDIELVVLDARGVLEQVTGQMAPLADEKGIELRLDATGDVEVMADGRRLVQILLNLLSNALKNTPHGGSIAVSARRIDERVELAVSDTGRGIPADHLERIFEEFTQVGFLVEGTGLGLPVSRKLARLMDGELAVASRSGHGSTFTLSLPAADGHAQALAG